MLLFYSEHCPHCRMLLETIQRHDSNGIVKRVSLEAMRAAGKMVPPAVHSVPAMLILPQKTWMFGKAVFDHLLLPGRGKLLVGAANGRGDATEMAPPGTRGGPGGPGGPGEPLAFGFGSGLSDAFASIADDNVVGNTGLEDRSYLWSSVTDAPAAHPAAVAATASAGGALPPAIAPSETRARKGLPSLDDIRRLRDEAV